MKLMDMLLIGGLAFLALSKNAGASSASPDGMDAGSPPPIQDASEPINMVAMPGPATLANNIQQTLSNIINATAAGQPTSTLVDNPKFANPIFKVAQILPQFQFTVPEGFPQLRGTAANQFTGNTTGAYTMNFLSGPVNFYPLDPRETKYEINNLIESARAASVGNPTMLNEFNLLSRINASWSQAYRSVL